MTAELVGLRGPQTGKRLPVGGQLVTFGRGPGNDVVLTSPQVSRVHAELRGEAGGYTLYDRGSSNGTAVNGGPVSVHQLRPGDEITIGEETFRWEISDGPGVSVPLTVKVRVPVPPALRVTITGGGPVGLSLALLLEHLMGPRVAVTIYESRWTQDGNTIRWKTPKQGNARRQQVVTIQSRQYLKLPPEVQQRLFTPGAYSEMWPEGPDSVGGLGPRNVRIAYVEDQLLAVANEKPGIRLVPESFDPVAATEDLVGQHVLAICEGSRSRTREHFADRFGAPDSSMYALEGKQVQDVVLGLRVTSELPDPMAVLLTVAQNRFLLNSLRGDGFLNMRLTDQEAKEVVGIDPVRQVFTECVQAQPCLMERTPGGEFSCARHDTLFLPALLKRSPFWSRVSEGLKLFGVPEENLTAVTCFRLDMVQRPRFTAQLNPRTASSPGTFGFLLGDAANAIHFWPGRGLNSGLASAVSLARSLAARRPGAGLRDADFLRHEALMAMLQYRHKSRAWRQMVTTDAAGDPQAIKDQIAQGITEGEQAAPDRDADLTALMERLRRTRTRLESRLPGLPDDATLQAHLEQLTGQTLHTLLVSEPWDSANVGGEEVDVDWLLAGSEAAAASDPEPAGQGTRAGPRRPVALGGLVPDGDAVRSVAPAA